MKAQLEKIKKNISSNRLALIFICLSIAFLALSVYGFVLGARIIDVSQQNIRGRLLEAAKRLATLTTAEELDKFREPADAAKPEWKALRQRLVVFARETDVKYAYYMRMVDEKIQFIVDNDFDEETRVGVDTELFEARHYLDLVPTLGWRVPPLGGEAIVAKLGEYSHDWPGLCAAYAPIFDSNGSVAAVCGVDLDDTEILSMFKTERTISILMVSMVIILSVFGGFCIKTLRRS
ncbi:MAG: hypothetical protein LBC63_10190 [Holophagales bacterium]|nr:hypothetical protein [Holophagales bacterium]